MKNEPQQKSITTNSARNIVILLVAVIVGAAAITFAVAQNANPATKNPLVSAVDKAAQTSPAAPTLPKTKSTATATNPAVADGAAPAATASADAATIDAKNSAAVEAAIAKVLQGVVKADDMPGMAAAVIMNGKILGAAAAGVRKRATPDPVLRDDPFHLGSCTKAFTATLIGILVDEGKLKWDSTIGELIGREINGINPDYAPVTIDQLLHHRSGAWPNGPSEVWKAAQNANGTPVEQRLLYVESILSQPPRFPAGKYLYSNAGYAILGFIAETITKTPYETLMEQKVFIPLGLTSAGFGNAGSEKELTAPYPHLETGAPTFLDNPKAITPAGLIHMNVTDWAKFCLVHLGHQPTPPLLKPQTLEHLHTLAGDVAEDKFGYACGWMRPNRDWAGGRTLHHAGSNLLNYCVVWLSPQKDFGVLAATNQGGKKAEAAVNEACTALIDEFLLNKK